MIYVPITAVIELTRICNLFCLHCGSNCSQTIQNNSELNTDEHCGLLEQLAGLGTESAMFSGGEPTLRPDLKKIIKKAKDLSLICGIITNGYRLKKEISDLFKSLPPDVIGVSLDGLAGTHNFIRGKKDSWAEALNSMLLFKDLGIEVCAITTLSKLNLAELPALFNLFNLLRIDSWQIQLAMPFGRMADKKGLLISEQEFQQACEMIAGFRYNSQSLNVEAADCFGRAPQRIIRRGEWLGCTAGTYSLGIDAYGNVLPCLSLRTGLSCGNIHEKSLREIWEIVPGFDFNRQFNPRSAADGTCKSCSLLENCRGGCASQSQAYYGLYHQAPFCYHRTTMNHPII